MVRSSYKKHKKNQKQSFKRRVTGGNRKVNFIEDDYKMVGGNDNQIAITGFMNKYKDYPIYGVLLGIYSNQKCASLDSTTGVCKDDNTAQLEASYKKSKDFMDLIPEVDNKPKALTVQELQKKDGKKLEYVGKVIDYLAQNVFIPKGLIKNVHVQNDDGTSWTTLTNTKFVEVKSETDNELKERAAAAAGENVRQEKIEHDDGEIMEKDETFKPTDAHKTLQAGINEDIKKKAPEDALNKAFQKMDKIINENIGSVAGGESKLKKMNRQAGVIMKLLPQEFKTLDGTPSNLNAIRLTEDEAVAIERWNRFKTEYDNVTRQENQSNSNVYGDQYFKDLEHQADRAGEKARIAINKREAEQKI